MKRFHVLVAVLPLLLFYSNSFAQSDCDIERPCSQYACTNCNEWSQWEERSEILIWPDDPDCRLIVSYCYRQCIDGGIGEHCIELNIINIQPMIDDFACGKCREFLDFINPGDPFVQALRLKNIFEVFWWQINMNNWNEFIGSGIPLENLKCDPYGNWQDEMHYKVTTTQMTCLAYCYTQHPIGNPSIPLLITQVPCSETFCCVRTMGFCIDMYTGGTLWTETKESYPPTDCSHSTIPLKECPPGENVTVTPCFNNCE